MTANTVEVKGMADLKRLLAELEKLGASKVAIAAPGEHQPREKAHRQQVQAAAAKGRKPPKAKSFRTRRSRSAPKVPIALLIAIHEFGLGVPQRSIVRGTFATSGKDIERLIVGETQRMIASKGKHTTAKVHAMVGKRVVEMMRRRIRSRIAPPLSDKTKRDPDRDRRYIPLLDTGQIERSLEWRSEGA